MSTHRRTEPATGLISATEKVEDGEGVPGCSVSAGSFRGGGGVVAFSTSSGTLGTILKGRLQDARISEPMRTTATSQDLLSVFIFTLPCENPIKNRKPHRRDYFYDEGCNGKS
jgi:hypothetical protein